MSTEDGLGGIGVRTAKRRERDHGNGLSAATILPLMFRLPVIVIFFSRILFSSFVFAYVFILYCNVCVRPQL